MQWYICWIVVCDQSKQMNVTLPLKCRSTLRNLFAVLWQGHVRLSLMLYKCVRCSLYWTLCILSLSFTFVQVKQEISDEFEQVKDISKILASFKSDNSRPYQSYDSYNSFDDYSRHEEPTRDPDVWPPPTPVEHRWEHCGLCIFLFLKFWCPAIVAFLCF